MNSKSSKLVALALAGSMAAASFAVPSFAQTQTNPSPAQNGSQSAQTINVHADGKMQRGKMQRGKMQRGNMGAGMLGLSCNTNAAAQMETRLDKTAQNLNLTDTQKTLFDTFKSDLLVAQTNFADACQLPQSRTEAQKMDLADRLAQRQTNLKARVDAMEGVIPAFSAFFKSLTPEQLTQMHRAGARAAHMRDYGQDTRGHGKNTYEHRKGGPKSDHWQGRRHNG